MSALQHLLSRLRLPGPRWLGAASAQAEVVGSGVVSNGHGISLSATMDIRAHGVRVGALRSYP